MQDDYLFVYELKYRIKEAGLHNVALPLAMEA
jgi:hypothetical protein